MYIISSHVCAKNEVRRVIYDQPDTYREMRTDDTRYIRSNTQTRLIFIEYTGSIRANRGNV